jgi:putative inorganic carbon (HCO3(-)) transporter
VTALSSRMRAGGNMFDEMTSQNLDAAFSIGSVYKNRSCSIVDHIIAVVLIGLLLFTPLPFGSVGEVFVFAIEITAAFCFLLLMFKLAFLGNHHARQRFAAWRRQERKTGHLRTYYSFFGNPLKRTGLEWIGVAFLLVLVLQIIPLPTFAVSMLSSSAGDLYATASNAAGISLSSHSLSVNAFTTIGRLLQYGSYFLIYIVTVNTIRTRQLTLLFIYALLASAFFQSAYGLYELFSGQQQIFWYKKKLFLNCATGTFINRNHYAAYLGISLPLLMALILRKIEQIRMNHTALSQAILWSMFMISISAAIACSLSLTALAAILVACACLLVFYGFLRRSRLILALFLVAGMGILGGWLGSETFRARVSGIPEEAFSERSRFVVWKDTFRIFLEFPLTGTGSGTFAEIFPVYRSFGTYTTYSETHNEYLQMLAEIGITMLFFFSIGLGTVLSRLIGIWRRPSSPGVLIRIGAFCSLLVLMLHNAFDFSMQIPAIAVTAAITMALFFGSYRTELNPS